jgi:hypothetical protein
MDTNTQLPIMTTHTPLFDEVHLKPLEVSLPVSRPLSISGTCSEEIGSNLKTGLGKRIYSQHISFIKTT